MSRKIIAQNEEVVIGVDVHDKSHSVAVLGMKREILAQMKFDSVTILAWERLFGSLPGCKTTVVYEAGPLGYTFCDMIREMGRKAVVVAPQKHVGPKTDKRDALQTGYDYLSGRASEVTVPEWEQRLDRQVVRLRDKLLEKRKQMANMLKSMWKGFGFETQIQRTHADSEGTLNKCAETMGKVIQELDERIEDLEKEMKKISMKEKWSGEIAAINKISGVGWLTAVEMRLQVADIGAFGNSGKFASYIGLCPGEWSSGESRRVGGITKRGPGRLRGLLVQCAWARIRCDADSKKRFEELSKRRGKRRAIVAIARRLAVEIYWVVRNLREQAAAAA